jgi:hypothetical protein
VSESLNDETVFVPISESISRFIGFEEKWSTAAAVVRERLDSITGGRAVCLVVAGVNPRGAGATMLRAGVMVVSDESIQFFNRTILDETREAVSPEVSIPLVEVTSVERTGGEIRIRTATTKVTFPSKPWLQDTVLAYLQAAVAEAQFDPDDVSDQGIGVIVLTAVGYPFEEGEPLRHWLTDTSLVFSTDSSSLQIEIPFDEVTAVEVGGRGEVTTGGGFIGGGFGLSGFLLGAATANVLNGLTTRTNVETLLRISTARGEINLFTSDLLPTDLDNALATVRAHASASNPNTSGVPDVLEQLEKLGALRASGVLTEDEFAAKKAALLERL